MMNVLDGTPYNDDCQPASQTFIYGMLSFGCFKKNQSGPKDFF